MTPLKNMMSLVYFLHPKKFYATDELLNSNNCSTGRVSGAEQELSGLALVSKAKVKHE